MSVYRPAEAKKEEFRKYLERGGVVEELTKLLVELYEMAEKPDDPLSFVKSVISQENEELEKLRAMVVALREENEELKLKLNDLEGDLEERE